MKKPLLVIFDGNALIHRGYHALPPLTLKKTGEMINAVFGFTQMLLKVLSELKPTCYAVAFDKKAPTFRHLMFKDYKAHRPTTPDELINQFGRVRQLVEAFKMPIYELDGFEADDLLGALSRQAEAQDIDVVIVTGDGDTMQLVTDKVKVLYPKPRRPFSDTMLYGEAEVKEKYGVTPAQIADLKALKGDPSDNIPGVSGIGDKTALSLIEKFGSVEKIYEHIEDVTPPKLRENLKAHEDIARQSKALATIDSNAPVTLDLASCQAAHFDRRQVSELFRELEFYSLLERLPEETRQMPLPALETGERAPASYKMINTAPALEELTTRLKASENFAFDTETTDLNAMTAQLVGISFAPASCEAYYIPVGHNPSLEQIPQLPLEDVLKRIKIVLEDPSLGKIAHNGKYDMTIFAQNGVQVNNLAFDTMVAAYLLGEKNLSLKAIAFGRLGIEMVPITDLIGNGSKQVCMSTIDVGRVSTYCCADSDVTGQLKDLLEKDLHEQGLWGLFATVEMPLIPILLEMEMNGVALDTGALKLFSRQLGEDLKKLEIGIYEAVGHQLNINSSQQLSVVLYQELSLPKAKKTQGGYSTDAAVLEGLKGSHPVIDMILEYRQLTKLKSTYVDALPALVNSHTGRLHTSFNQTRTTTGRLSSSDPNLQNIPIRGELGKKVRQAFIALPGSLLVAGDYSQIDLRSLAHLSKDPTLISAFQQNEDIHTATAAQLFNVPPEGVKAEMRRLAKVVNFGVIYGMSEFGLQQATELSREEARKFISAYFGKYPQVKLFLEATKQQARELGYVQTLLGRRRSIPEINSSNRIIREAAERMAINMPVQGTSADIIKVAMVSLDKEMKSRRVKSKMLLQVHDELIFEVPEDELDLMIPLIREVMSHALVLDVPLKVDIKTGPNWGAMES